MKVAAPLYLKFWLWLALNLLLLASLLLVIAGRDGPGWRMLLTEPVRERLATMAADVGRVLSDVPQDTWPTVLAQLGEVYGASFQIGRAPRDGPPPRGGVHVEGFEKRPPPPPRPELPAGDAREFDRLSPPDGALPKRGPPPSLDRRMRADLITLRGGFVGPFLLTIPATIQPQGKAGVLYDIQVEVADLFALLGLLGVQNWVLYPLLALGLSALLWLPLVWSITRALARITQTTERIAEGEFGARIAVRRRDELGQLGASVNRMAERLGGHLAAQKQFLADVAHEVASPLARLRVALGLYGAAPPAAVAERTLQDMNDDLQLMADLLDDLLLFSRADIGAQQRALESVEVAPAIASAIEHEGARTRVPLHAQPELRALADRAMLERAVANLVRNALRYAGQDDPIDVIAKEQDERVVIQVRDRGPGVPDAVLARLGEPFFRVESSRTRDRGGFGLGLAIVKRCVEACAGELVFRNREGAGFEAEIRLRATAHAISRRRG